LLSPPPPTSALFPYTTLFRSHGDLGVDRVGQGLGDAGTRDRQDLDASTALDQRRNGIGSDQRDSPRAARGDREDSAVVFEQHERDRKSTRLNSSHLGISYAVF